MATGDVIQVKDAGTTPPFVFDSPVTAGNTVFLVYRQDIFGDPFPARVSESSSAGDMTLDYNYDVPDPDSTKQRIYSKQITASGSSQISTLDGGDSPVNARQAFIMEVEGSFDPAAQSGTYYTNGDADLTMTFPTASVASGTIALGTVYVRVVGAYAPADPAWVEHFDAGGDSLYSRKNTAETIDFTGEASQDQRRFGLYGVYDPASSGPTLSSVPATAFPGQSRTVTGTGFGATQGTGSLTIGGVAQTITAWSDTSITFTTVQGNNKYEAGKTLEVTTGAATTVSDTVELVADTANGFGYVDMSSPNTSDESSVAFNTTPTVVTGDQFEWEDFNNLGNLTVDAQGFVTNVDTEGTFRGRFWDATDSTWGTVENFTAETEDTTAPTVTSVGVPTAGSYVAGQDLDFTVNASETVTVTTTGGTPSIPVTIGSTVRQATYVSGSGTSALLFRYTTQAGDNDGDGISVGSSISLNGGTIQDGASNNLVLTLNSVGSTAGVLVDTVKPVITPNGANPATVVVGGTYTDAGAAATDNIDGSLGSVTGTGSVDTNAIGQYTITYPGAGVVDSAGNVAEDATRIVNVVAEDPWPFGKGIKYAATKNWEWGKRHPKTGMRVRVYK